MDYSYSINTKNNIILNAPIEINGSIVLNSNNDNFSHFNKIFTTKKFTATGSNLNLYSLPRFISEDSIMNLDISVYYTISNNDSSNNNFGYINKKSNIHFSSDITTENPISILYSSSDSTLYPYDLTFNTATPNIININVSNSNSSKPNLYTSTIIEYSYLKKIL